MEYSSGRSSVYGSTSATRSLYRFKLGSEYRAMLRQVIRRAPAAERLAKTHLAKARVRLQKFEAETELASLEAGGVPSAVQGFIAIRSM